KRPQISYSIFIIWQFLAILISFGICSMGLFYIWFWNIRVYQILDKSKIRPSKYTLRARFQAKENVRSFAFSKYAFFFISSCLVFRYSLILLQSFDFLQKYEIMLNYVMEFGDASHPNVIVPIIMLSVPNPKKVYSEFFTTSKYEMIQIKNSLFDSPFFSIGSILLTHYMVFAILGLTGITVERSLATFWINDYEKKPRNWIPIFVLTTLQLISWLIAYSAIQILLDIYSWLMIGILVLTFNFLLMGYIWYWNVQVHRILDNFKIIPSKYTLQARFQAKENAKSLSFLKITVVVISSALIFECVFFILQASNVFRDYEVILYYLVDYAIHALSFLWQCYRILVGSRSFLTFLENSKILKILLKLRRTLIPEDPNMPRNVS
ncbi:Protein CBR-SRE-40, partial [Caenorhabditis briggsae]